MPVYNPYDFWKDSSLSMVFGPKVAAPTIASSANPGPTVDPRLYMNPWAVDKDVDIADPSVRFIDNGAGEFSLTSRGFSDSASDYFDDDSETIPFLEEKNIWAAVDSFTSYRDPTSDGDDHIGSDSGNSTSLTALRYPFSSHPLVGALSDATRSPSSVTRADSAPALTRRHSVTGYDHLPNTFSWRSSGAGWAADEAPASTAVPPAFYGGLEDGLDRLRLDERPDFDPVDDPLPFRDDFPHYQDDIPGSYSTESHTWPSEHLSISSSATTSAAHLPAVVGYLTSYISAPAQKTSFASSSLAHALSPKVLPRDDGHAFLVERERASTRTTASRKAPKASRGVDAAVVQSRRMHPVLFHCSNCRATGKACDFTSKYSLNRHINSTHRGFLAFCDYPGCQMTFRHTVSRNRHVAKKHLQDYAEIGLTRARQRTRKKLPPEAKARLRIRD